ncbi:MAG: D-hexose-6-phosphate mutarotase [Steroidobacterales bacterium]
MTKFRAGPNGLQFVDLANAQAAASICTQGAQLTHWQPRSQKHRVTFTAAAVQYNPGKSFRTGIPICWPWFGPHPTDKSKPNHGFARNLVWEAGDAEQIAGGATRLVLVLTDSEQTRALWPHPYRLECRITVGEALEVELATTNTGSTPFVITEALHTYFAIGDIGAIQVLGLDGAQYVDSADGGRRKRQAGAVTFSGEVDRVFLDTESVCTIVDPLMERRVEIAKTGSRSTVVWNPWQQKAGGFADLGAATSEHGSWRQMVCVESANALDNQLSVAPGQSHSIAVRYRALPL